MRLAVSDRAEEDVALGVRHQVLEEGRKRAVEWGQRHRLVERQHLVHRDLVVPADAQSDLHELVGVAAARNRGERLEGEADRGARRARLEHDCEHVPRALDVGARQLLEGAHRDAVRREPHDLLFAGRARSARIKDGGPVELHDGLAWGPERRRVLEHSLQSRAQGLAGDPHAKLWCRLTAQADPRASVAGMLSGNKVDALGLGRLAGNAHARRRRHAASAA
mmetsp:Transcript_29886/g.96114  ORF Transcript_29886/g.96114 Transcript_29886/m.96114 type:complete len:222 (-) Transcript_29886:50-715(-)